MTIRASRRALLGAALLGVSAPWAAMRTPVAAHGEEDGSPVGPAGVELPPYLGESDLRVYVPATGHTLGGVFLDYWRATGGETVYGNPISEPFAAANGYHSQAFARGVFQYRPEFLFTDEPIVRLMPIGAVALATRVGVVRGDGKRGGGGGDRRAQAWQSAAATADGASAALGRAVTGVFGEWYEHHEGHFFLGRQLGKPVAEHGRTVQYFEGGMLTREGATARLAPLAAELASRLGIETERVPRADLPDYDESLFETAPNPNPVGRADATGPKRIEINLTEQRLWAFQGNTPVTTSLVTTGLAPNTTEQGRFRVRLKYPEQDMAGFTSATGEVLAVDDGSNTAVAGAAGTYAVDDVPDVMYFNMDAEALHGAYWRDSFGEPGSHGCVNLPVALASYLYGWAPLGTPVWVHE